MNDNNTFNNDNNLEENSAFSENTGSVESLPNPPKMDNDSEEVEIELDAEIYNTNTNYDNSYKYVNANDLPAQDNYNNENLEPIPPIMPKIEKSEYKPIVKSASGKGIKLFAVITALMIIASACITGGYYLGKNTTAQSDVDLAAKPAPDNALTISQVFKEVDPSIVGIYIYNSEKGIVSTATGVVYSEDGYIVTNDHIYDGVTSAKFKVYTDDQKMLSAEYVAGDTRSDLAVLKITDTKGIKLTPAKFGNSEQTVVGESVVAIGRPNGATNPSIVSEGIISAASTRVSITTSYSSNLIQTDTAINPGSSGGALCNVYGQVIGITFAKLIGEQYDGIGYAIPSTTVKKVVDSLIQHKTVKGRAKLGISYKSIDELSAELLKLPCGLQIATIDKTCGLYGKSVEIEDIITHINGIEITDSNIVLDIIDAASPGDMLDLKIYSVKNKKSIDIKVKLLEDVGSSSYTTKKQKNDKNDEESKNNKEYNSSEFNFPNGE